MTIYVNAVRFCPGCGAMVLQRDPTKQNGFVCDLCKREWDTIKESLRTIAVYEP